jgi:HEAT repeat protein
LKINKLPWIVMLAVLARASFATPSATLEQALGRLDGPDVLVADAAVEEIVAFGPPAVDSLLKRLAAPGRDVRAGAIRGLGLLGDARARQPLRSELQHSLSQSTPPTMESRYLRILLIQAVGRLRDVEAGPLLQAAGASPDAFERAHAGLSLMVMALDPGYDLVREAGSAPDPALRALVAEGLGASREDRARALLLDLARDEAWVVRDAAFRSLAAFRADPAVAAALERGAADPSWFVRQSVAHAASGGSPTAGGTRESTDPPAGDR